MPKLRPLTEDQQKPSWLQGLFLPNEFRSEEDLNRAILEWFSASRSYLPKPHPALAIELKAAGFKYVPGDEQQFCCLQQWRWPKGWEQVGSVFAQTAFAIAGPRGTVALRGNLTHRAGSSGYIRTAPSLRIETRIVDTFGSHQTIVYDELTRADVYASGIYRPSGRIIDPAAREAYEQARRFADRHRPNWQTSSLTDHYSPRTKGVRPCNTSTTSKP